jgi:hypothetical protein
MVRRFSVPYLVVARQAPVHDITIELLFWFIGDTTTLAGTGVAGFADGDSTSAQFKKPKAVAMAADGAVVVADMVSCTLSPFVFWLRVRLYVYVGHMLGLGNSLSDRCFYLLCAFCRTRFDWCNQMVRRFAKHPVPALFVHAQRQCMISQSNCFFWFIGDTTTLAGTGGTPFFRDGDSATAYFKEPQGVAFASNGALIVADAVSCTLSPFTFSGPLMLHHCISFARASVCLRWSYAWAWQFCCLTDIRIYFAHSAEQPQTSIGAAKWYSSLQSIPCLPCVCTPSASAHHHNRNAFSGS